MRILPMGSDAVLVEVAGLAEASAAYARLAIDPPAGVIDLVPAAATVLVRFDRRMLAPARVREWIAAAAGAPAPPPSPAASVVVPIVYDGDDLDETAALLGMSAGALAARHAATEWTVAFTGFAPGFGYLVGAGWDLDVPRLAAPRTRVPAGSVGLAGAFSGAYPRETPGGWRLIGRTDAPLFRPQSAEPVLLGPGTAVRFEPGRGATATRDAAAAASARPPLPAPEPDVEPDVERGVEAEPGRIGRPSPPRGLRVVAPGAQATIQDGGRPGRAAEGIAASGAADPAAWALGNRLLGNACGAAAIEVVLGGFRAVAETDLTVVVTGAWAPIRIDGRIGDPYVVHAWPADSELQLGAYLGGTRAYLSVRGGWDAVVAVGSRSTDTLSGLGPAPLRAGDRLGAGTDVVAPPPVLPFAPWGLPPAATDAVPLDVPFAPGPRADWFDPASIELLASAVWTVSAEADRVGIRLEGPALGRIRSGELASEGAVPGAIQVTASGQPVVFGPDGPVTGGYPVVGIVTAIGRARLAQARPGDRVRLRRGVGA